MFSCPDAVDPEQAIALAGSEGVPDAYERTRGDYLWHYTSASSFLEILRTRALWASDIRFLNDAREFSYAIDVLQRVRQASAGPHGPEVTAFLEELTNSAMGGSRILGTVFVASFSELADDLTQWRAYAPLNGVAIGFESRRLRWFLETAGFRLVQCIYDETEQVRVVRSLIDSTIDRFRADLAAGIVATSRERLKNEFVTHLVELATRLKHPSFRDEKEWRGVSAPIHPFEEAHQDLAVRAGRAMPIPHKIISLAYPDCTSPHPVMWPATGATIGPCLNPGLSEYAVRLALRHCYPGDQVRVSQSDTPYRPWS